ncbi:MAG: N-acetyl sugar amidotransferase [Patescibacteria group bacterium]
MKRCSKCVMLETQDMISFDKDGVCATCRQIEYKQNKIDWDVREKEFRGLLDQYRGKGPYDCIVPFSGGKDSTFTAFTLVKKFNLRPLIVSFDHGFYRPNVLAYNERTVKMLGVDYMKFKSDWQTVKKLMRESLIRKGDIMWHSHCGIYAFPMHMAVALKVPLLIWGEPTSEYVSYYSYEEYEQVDEKRFNRVVNLGINAEDMVGFLDSSVTFRDLWAYTYPKLSDLRAIGYRSICLGNYIPWDTRKQSELIRNELDWQGDRVEGIPYERYWYEKVEDAFQGIQDYLKWLKRGMSRMTHLASIDIRNGRMTRDEALKMIEKYEGYRPASLDVFLKAIGMSDEEFHEIALKHLVAPHVPPDWRTLPRGEELPDQKFWTINNDIG